MNDTKKKRSRKPLLHALRYFPALLIAAAGIKAGLGGHQELAVSLLTLGCVDCAVIGISSVWREVKALQARKSDDRVTAAVLNLVDELIEDGVTVYNPLTQERRRIAARLLSDLAAIAAEERAT